MARLILGMAVVGVCFIGLGLLKFVQWICGFEEQEFYKQFPASWYAVVTLGLGFTASLIYSAKKAFDTNPNTQLRHAPDAKLRELLADPEYAFWHNEAQKLLDKRNRN